MWANLETTAAKKVDQVAASFDARITCALQSQPKVCVAETANYFERKDRWQRFIRG